MAFANHVSPRSAYAPLVESVADGFDMAARRFAPAATLAARLWLAQGFFVSGVVKLSSWPTTLVLYAVEHPVPGFAPHLAAVVGTGIELICPILLALGFMTRIAALPLLATVAFLQFGYQDLTVHWYWMLALGWIVIQGPGAFSLDRAIAAQLASSALPCAGGMARLLTALTRFGGPLAAVGLRLWLAVLAWGAATAQAANWTATVGLFGTAGERPYYPAEALAGLAIGVEFLAAALIATGLVTRCAAVALMAAIVILPYPGVGDGLMGWRLLLLGFLVLDGAGELSLDQLLRRRIERLFPSLVGDLAWLERFHG
jgi:uncharacterized membrane protein YphA (DoxX/SURF4 family)